MKYLFLAVLCLIIAAAFIYCERVKRYVPAVMLKGIASLCFVLLGLLGWKLSGMPHYGKMIVIGLALGCIADVLLNLRYVFEKVGSLIFLVGILVFLSGHVMYLIALIPQCAYLWIYLAIGILATFFALKWIFSKITAKIAFKIFGIFYIGAIVIMTSVAFGSVLTNPCARTWIFMIGAILFLFSDIVLILNTFGRKSKFSLRIVNLSLYYLGQILIALTLQLH